MADTDYYKILGVEKDADTAKIKSAYRELALKYHPDRNEGDNEAAGKMKVLNEAYAVLSDPVKKRDYDNLQRQYGPSRGYSEFRNTYSDQDIFSGNDIHQVFDDLAKSFGFRNFDEIAKGFDKGQSRTFEFKDKNIHVNGFFFFGTFSLGKLNLPGLIGRAAQLFLGDSSGAKISIQGRDLHDTIRIDPDLAGAGGPYAYYHEPMDKKLIVKIPPNTRHGRKIRLSGLGEQGDGKPGDLYLKVDTRPRPKSWFRKLLGQSFMSSH